MQLLATKSDEGEGAIGLGVIPGQVIRIESSNELRVPHVGWNEVHLRRTSRLFDGLEDGRDFYFVHSYHFVPESDDHVVAVTPYGSALVAVVARGSVYGVQFHPEKSQRTGFALLRNFLTLAGCGSTHEASLAGAQPPRR
jgi:glutamine amidotransferase